MFVQQMDELQVIVGFVQAAKRLKTVCKWDGIEMKTIISNIS